MWTESAHQTHLMHNIQTVLGGLQTCLGAAAEHHGQAPPWHPGTRRAWLSRPHYPCPLQAVAQDAPRCLCPHRWRSHTRCRCSRSPCMRCLLPHWPKRECQESVLTPGNNNVHVRHSVQKNPTSNITHCCCGSRNDHVEGRALTHEKSPYYISKQKH